jgi:hypothetical protein
LSLKSDKNKECFAYAYAFMIISRSVLLRMRNVSDKHCREIENAHCMFNNLFFENCVVCDVTSKNIVGPDRHQMTTWRTRIAYWIAKATDTHSECVILIPFPTATMVARTRLNVTSYVNCLSGLFFLRAELPSSFEVSACVLIMPSEFNFRRCWLRGITYLIRQ